MGNTINTPLDTTPVNYTGPIYGIYSIRSAVEMLLEQEASGRAIKNIMQSGVVRIEYANGTVLNLHPYRLKDGTIKIRGI